MPRRQPVRPSTAAGAELGPGKSSNRASPKLPCAPVTPAVALRPTPPRLMERHSPAARVGRFTDALALLEKPSRILRELGIQPVAGRAGICPEAAGKIERRERLREGQELSARERSTRPTGAGRDCAAGDGDAADMRTGRMICAGCATGCVPSRNTLRPPADRTAGASFDQGRGGRVHRRIW